MRKTFNVESFKEKCNWKLANSFMSYEALQELCLTLEDVLHETGNYAGFRYLIASEVPNGELPGIRNTDCQDNAVWFIDTNEYRRRYS